MKETLGVAHVHVAGNVPPVTHVLLLAFGKPEIAASCRAAHGQQSRGAVRDLLEVFVDDHGLVPRYNLSSGTRPGMAGPSRYKDVKYFGGSQAVQDFHTCRIHPRRVRRL